jgi:histidine triad (HIT) family protein
LTGESCPFCDRVSTHDYDAGDSWSVTFEPLSPVTPGHRLFVPRRHVADALSEPALAGLVMEYATWWASKNGMRPCNLITSCGPEASQSVFHFHVHLVPRRDNDGLALPWHSGRKKKGAA